MIEKDQGSHEPPGDVVKLQDLQELREAGLLSWEEYAAKRAEIIASL